jgi:hypothetical protein
VLISRTDVYRTDSFTLSGDDPIGISPVARIPDRSWKSMKILS